MLNKIKNYIKDFISFNFLDNIDVEDSALISTLKNKLTLLFSILIALFFLTKFFHGLFFIGSIALTLYATFEFIRTSHNVVLSKDRLTLLYFYILLPIIFVFEINNKFGSNFLFWFLSYIVCLKFVNTYVKNLFDKEQSKTLLLLLTSMFSIFYGFIFSFVLKIGMIKLISVNLLILIVNYYESIWLKNFKEDLNINTIMTPVLANIDGFIFSGLLLNVLRIFSIL